MYTKKNAFKPTVIRQSDLVLSEFVAGMMNSAIADEALVLQTISSLERIMLEPTKICIRMVYDGVTYENTLAKTKDGSLTSWDASEDIVINGVPQGALKLVYVDDIQLEAFERKYLRIYAGLLRVVLEDRVRKQEYNAVDHALKEVERVIHSSINGKLGNINTGNTYMKSRLVELQKDIAALDIVSVQHNDLGLSKTVAHMKQVYNDLVAAMNLIVPNIDIAVSATNELQLYLKHRDDRYLGQSINFKIRELIDEQVSNRSSVMQQSNMDLIVNIAEDVPAICIGDTERLNQVFQVLLDNAWRFTPDKGKIYLRLSAHNFNTIEKTFLLDVEVEDTGKGIPLEDQAKLFVNMHKGSNSSQARTQSTGIGLFTCAEMMPKLKGKIWLKSSEIDKGSVFAFTVELHLP